MDISTQIQELERENGLLRRQISTLTTALESMTTMKLEAELTAHKQSVTLNELLIHMRTAFEGVRDACGVAIAECDRILRR